MAELTREKGEAARRVGGGGSLPVVKAPKPGHALPGHVVSHASGGRDLWSDPLPRRPDDPEAAVWNLLREVLDPELPISLVDLGLIYGVAFREGRVEVDLTFTATACPCMEFIREDVRDRLLRERWITEVRIREVWDPPWTRDRISDRGREQLRRLGVGV